jgi:hypothetical protein
MCGGVVLEKAVNMSSDRLLGDDDYDDDGACFDTYPSNYMTSYLRDL